MSSRPGIHLVGSVGLANEEDVFRSLAGTIGSQAARYPDGETGKRHYWIRWQQRVFAEHPQLESAGDAGAYRDGTPLRYYRMRTGTRPQDIAFGALGYAAAALNSYRTFARLKKEAVIPATVRFMVALPTPTAVITSFMLPAERQALEPAYEQALLQELHQIVQGIAADQLAIQWDVCHEILAADGAFPLHYGDVLEGTLVRLARLSGHVPAGVQLGFHLCYGDPGHKHIKEPVDTGTAVAFANGIAARVGRRIEWLHLPVPRERSDEAYFTALKNLRLKPETELVLGLVHYTDGIEGTLRRARTAKKFAADFGIATECGFGRRDAKTIPDLLRIHAEVAGALG